MSRRVTYYMMWGFLMSAGVTIVPAAVEGTNPGASEPEEIPHSETTLWYRQPADPEKWEQALPLGNGRLGAMIFGGVEDDRILYNEDSVWSGWPEPDNDREGAYAALVKIRKLLKDGADQKQINKLAMEEFCSLHGYGKPDFGAYQSFCDARFTFDHDPTKIRRYHRSLDLETAVATVRLREGEIDYTREYFCSHPDQVAAASFSASEPGQISFRMTATSLHPATKVVASEHGLVLSGQVDTGDADHPGMQFEARWRIRADGGTVVHDPETSSLEVKNADRVTVVMAGATNYKLAYPHYRGDPPAQRNQSTLDRASSRSYAQLRAAHIRDHQSIFGRVALDLGKPSPTDLPTDERLSAYQGERNDRGLEALLFQYGRYLLIASSRVGGMPANLQGLWNNSNRPPWNGDYHLNINLQMNYWPLNSCNLADCAEPLIRWTEDLTRPGSKSARIHYQARGWVAHHTANVWGFTPPGPNRGVHMLEAESGAFLCQNIWDHYAFTQDREYLATTAWPILKGAAEFWLDSLQEVEGGVLAVSPSYSPEHGPLSDGAFYQTMIIWDLFSNCIEAAETLEIEPNLVRELTQVRGRLQMPRVGAYGQLQEWRDPALETNANQDTHRHISHMYAVHPGRQIIRDRDVELARAAEQSMIYRGDGATGWSMGWKINIWARLGDGDHAHRLVQNLIAGKLYPNLWDAHPPFQIDGNFGYTAGVAEMLLQSHTRTRDAGQVREIVLLPALPTAWRTGQVRGLQARGGFTVDVAWQDGTLTSATLHSTVGGAVVLCYADERVLIKSKSGETVHLDGGLTLRSSSASPVSSRAPARTVHGEDRSDDAVPFPA